MKSNPGTSILHVFSECSPLCHRIRSGIKKNYYLVFSKKSSIHVIPVICRIISEVISGSHFSKPPVCLMNETYMGFVVFGSEKGYRFEFWSHLLFYP